MATMIGTFCWHDLSTEDLAGGQAFYAALFGWGLVPHNDEYQMWQNGEKVLGGSMQLPAEAKAMGAPPHWMAYTAVEDVAATVALAQELGAQVFVPPTPIPGVGEFAILMDPQGAAFAVYGNGGDAGELGEAGVGDFSWGELCTTDSAGASAFYGKLFGWQFEDTDMGGGMMYRLFKTADSGRHLGGMFDKMPDMPAPTAWLHYVTVADIEASLAKVTELGGQVLNGPMEVPGGDRVAQCMDPQGAPFALHQSPPAA